MSGLRVLMTCIGGFFGIDTMTALRLDRDLNVHIIGVDANPQVVNRFFADRFHPVPKASESPEDFLTALLDICQKESVDVVIPGADEEVLALSHAKKRFLDAGVKCAVEDSAKVELARDKVRLFDRFSELGIPVPKYAAVTSAQDITRVASELGYPDHRFILKPRAGRGARGLIVVDAASSEFTVGSEARGYGLGNLESVVDRLRQEWKSLSLMAMEFLPGAIFDVDCVAVEGTPLCIVPRRRLWDTPFSRGVEGHQIERNGEIEQVTRQIAVKLSLNYIFDCDFGTAANGRPGLLELNPRWSGSVAAGLAGSVNVPSILARSIVGLPIPPVDLRVGARVYPVTRMGFPGMVL